MKLLIIGSGRHGKDTVAEILEEKFGLKTESSSYAAFKLFIYNIFKEKYGYNSLDEAYEDRVNHREELFKLIQEYNKYDKARLAKDILKHYDIYTGLRCKEELEACIEQDVFDLIIWVDASDRVDYKEGSDSMTVDKSYADVIIDNNGTYEELENKVTRLFNQFDEFCEEPVHPFYQDCFY